MNIVKLVISFCDHCVLLCNKCAKCMGLYFSCFWMSSLDAFSPRLYVFVVCSICRRKKFIVLVERLIHSVVFGLGHDGTVLFVTFSVTSFLISRLCRWCSVSFFLLRCPIQSVGLAGHGLDETSDSITPYLTKSKAIV